MTTTSASDFAPLPPDAPSQTYVTVSAIRGGSIQLFHSDIFGDVAPDEGQKQRSHVPCFAFLVDHPREGKMLFDLGLRKDGKGYPKGAQFDADDLLAECTEDVAEQLRDGGVEPGEIRRIVYRCVSLQEGRYMWTGYD